VPAELVAAAAPEVAGGPEKEDKGKAEEKRSRSGRRASRSRSRRGSRSRSRRSRRRSKGSSRRSRSRRRSRSSRRRSRGDRRRSRSRDRRADDERRRREDERRRAAEDRRKEDERRRDDRQRDDRQGVEERRVDNLKFVDRSDPAGDDRRAGLSHKPAWMTRGTDVNKEVAAAAPSGGAQVLGETAGDLVKPGLPKADLEQPEKQVPKGPSGPDPFGDVFREAKASVGSGSGGGNCVAGGWRAGAPLPPQENFFSSGASSKPVSRGQLPPQEQIFASKGSSGSGESTQFPSFASQPLRPANLSEQYQASSGSACRPSLAYGGGGCGC
ncbi:unnamed protein product, partial [Polarella glacialis]